MLRYVALTAFLLLPLMACAQSRLAPGEAGSAPRMGEEPAPAEPLEPQPIPVTPPSTIAPAPPVAPPAQAVPAQPPGAVPGSPPATSSPPAAGLPQPVMPDMTPNCMRPAQLIGQPQSAIGTVQFTNPTRVLGPGSAATMDYSPNRTNILLDAQGIIREITCG